MPGASKAKDEAAYDDTVALAQPSRSADMDDDDSVVEPEERTVPAAEAPPPSKLEPKFEDENHDEDDHIRDGKPGDIRPF